jgi:hypothetical protein
MNQSYIYRLTMKYRFVSKHFDRCLKDNSSSSSNNFTATTLQHNNIKRQPKLSNYNKLATRILFDRVAMSNKNEGQIFFKYVIFNTSFTHVSEANPTKSFCLIIFLCFALKLGYSIVYKFVFECYKRSSLIVRIGKCQKAKFGRIYFGTK